MQTLNSLGMNIHHGSSAVSEYVLPDVENKYNSTRTSVDGIDFIRNIVFEFHGSPFHGWEFYGKYYLRGFFGCSSVLRLKRTYEKELAILNSGYKLCVAHGVDLAEANRMLGSDMPFRMLDPNIYMSGIIEPVGNAEHTKIGFVKSCPQKVRKGDKFRRMRSINTNLFISLDTDSHVIVKYKNYVSISRLPDYADFDDSETVLLGRHRTHSDFIHIENVRVSRFLNYDRYLCKTSVTYIFNIQVREKTHKIMFHCPFARNAIVVSRAAAKVYPDMWTRTVFVYYCDKKKSIVFGKHYTHLEYLASISFDDRKTYADVYDA
jgi:hypothetical protein